MIKTDEKMKDGSFYYWHTCNKCGNPKGYKNRKGASKGYCLECQKIIRNESGVKARAAKKDFKLNEKFNSTKLVKEGVSKESLRELFDYLPEGVLVWKDTYGAKRQKGTVLGGSLANNSRTTKFCDKVYTLAQLIWVWHYGDLEGEVYKINRLPHDNRIENLQDSRSVLDTWDFIKRSLLVHGYTYDYSKVDYTGTQNHVTIICKEHGEFEVVPHYHISGGGVCPICYPKGFDRKKPGILYYLKFRDMEIYKIGITNRSIDNRFLKKERDLFEVISTEYFENGDECYLKEQELHDKYKEYKYTGSPLLVSGNTELYSCDVLNLE